MFFFHSLSLLEVLLECVGEPLWVLDELPLPLLQRLLAGRPGDEGRHVVHRVQQLLDGACDLPGKRKKKKTFIGPKSRQRYWLFLLPFFFLLFLFPGRSRGGRGRIDGARLAPRKVSSHKFCGKHRLAGEKVDKGGKQLGKGGREGIRQARHLVYYYNSRSVGIWPKTFRSSSKHGVPKRGRRHVCWNHTLLGILFLFFFLPKLPKITSCLTYFFGRSEFWAMTTPTP